MLRINDFVALIVSQRNDYINSGLSVDASTSLRVQPVVYLGSVPSNITLPDFTDDQTVTVRQPQLQSVSKNIPSLRFSDIFPQTVGNL